MATAEDSGATAGAGCLWRAAAHFKIKGSRLWGEVGVDCKSLNKQHPLSFTPTESNEPLHDSTANPEEVTGGADARWQTPQ